MRRRFDPSLLAVAALTAVGLALRLPGLWQGLFGDELFLYAIVTRPRAGEVVQAVHDSESTPPFHFLLAWAATKLGDPSVSFRLPSLVLGTAAIPLTYMVGIRAAGRRAALLGAAFLALSPFAVFYAVEARAYATLTFLAALSALALLEALRRGSRWWLAAWALASLLILYTHYTGVFVVAAQAAWALLAHRERLRELLVASAAIAVGYVAWIPSFLVQRQDSSATRISTFKSFTPEGFFRELTISAIGHPFEPLQAVPGRAAEVLLAVGAAVAAAGLVLRPPRPLRAALASGTGLVAVAALATPLGLALYSTVSQNVYIPRNLSTSLPALCLLLAAGLTRLRPALAAAAALTVLAALTIGTATTLESRYSRPPYRVAAEFLDSHARPGDSVVEYPLFANYKGGTFSFERSRSNVSTLLGHHLDVHFERPHRFFQVEGYERSAWVPAARRPRLFVVLPWDAAHREKPALPAYLRPRYRLVQRRVWEGLVPVAVLQYEPRGAQT